MQVRDGPAAVRGDASAPTRHWPPGWEGGTGGRPESEDLPLARQLNPSRKEDSLLRKLLAVSMAALVVVPAAAAARVHVRVEGKTHTIFGATAPFLNVQANALDALEAASNAGEFYYHVQPTSFGPYVDQIARWPSAGQSGWVFKVNGKSPPVGADAVSLKEGDRVLWYWATFSDAGGPKTLALERAAGQKGCYRVYTEDDNGVRAAALGAVLHVGRSRTVETQGATQAAVGCVGKHRGLVRATLAGAVRSNALA